jgi:tetratricopeptide (TPR) repeat protein
MSRTEWEPRIRRITDNVEERLVYAASLVRQQNLEQAYNELRKILDKNDYSYAATLLLGLVYQGMKRTEDALDCYLKAMKLDPMQSQPAMLAGFATTLLGDREEAARLFEVALHVEPNMAAAHLGLARLLRKPEEVLKAEYHAQSALRAEPHLTQARVVLAGIYRRMGEVDKAINELEIVLQAQAPQPPTVVLLATLYTDKKQHDKAIALLEYATNRWPTQASIWSRLGYERIRVGDHTGAEQAFREYIKLRPKDKAAPLRLVEALVPQGKLDEALDLLPNIPRRGKLTALVHKNYGDIYAAQRRYDEALDFYRAAVRQGPDGTQVIAAIESSAAGGTKTVLVEKYRDTIQREIDEGRQRVLSGDFSAANPIGNPPETQRITAVETS